MSIQSRIIASAAAVASAAVVLIGLTAGASAYQCKTHPEMAAFVSPDHAASLHTSRAIWTSKVRQKFGLEWSVYSIAANPTQICQNGNGGVQCIVTAKPCKYVVQ